MPPTPGSGAGDHMSRQTDDTQGNASHTTPPTPPSFSLESPSAATAPKRWLTPLRIIAIVVIVATLGILLRALLTPAVTSSSAASATPGAAAPLVNHYAPNAILLDLNNKPVQLSSFRGKVVILNFWYVACAPCQFEMPALQHAYDAQYSKGLVVVGVNTSDDAASITQFVKTLGVTYPILRDVNQRTTVEYRVVDTPTSFFIDRQGVIRYKVIGPLNTATLNRETSALLASG